MGFWSADYDSGINFLKLKIALIGGSTKFQKYASISIKIGYRVLLRTQSAVKFSKYKITAIIVIIYIY